jgi:hypothetical protein
MVNRGHRILVLSLFLLFFLVGVRLNAQHNSEITGTVSDKEGAAIPNAQVTATETSTGFTSTTQSNSAGIYTIPNLNVGTFDLKVTANGFQTQVQRGLQVNVSQVLRADVTMQVGSVSETVEVSAAALVVQTDSNVVSHLISAEQISEIATQNRNFAALAGIVMGASSMLPDNNTPTSGVGGNFNLSINGLRQSHNIWLIDGGESDDRGGGGGMQIMPSQDGIAQFEVLASNYPPEYGISSGATVSLSLKNGTKTFHGGAWEFNRNTVYNANNFFNKFNKGSSANFIGRQQLNYNIFGYNIGGPVMIPGVYNTDRSKTFFFWNQEWRKIIQATTPGVQNTLPAADFPVAGQALHYVTPAYATSPIQLKAPLVGDPAFVAKLAAVGLKPGDNFPGNIIPASLFDPNALLYFNSGIIPHPSTNGDKAIGSARTPINVRDDILRLDHRITDKWTILAHYIHDSVTQGSGGPMLGWSGATWNTITSTVTNPANSAAVKVAGTISPNLLLEASFNYDANIIDIVNSPNSLIPSGWTVNRFFANSSKNMPSMTWGAPYNTNSNPGSAPWHNAAADYSPKVDVSYLVGKHNMKFGFSYNRYTKNQQLFGNWGGNFNWGTQTNDSMMDMLLGVANTYDQQNDLPIRHYVNQTTSFYVSDNWKVTPSLSLQLGLRYDALPHAWERNNLISNFDPNLYQAGAMPTWVTANWSVDPTKQVASGPISTSSPGVTTINGLPFYLNGIYTAGQTGFPRGLVTNNYSTLQPRVGFSQDVFGNGRTVIRGGFGTFYERIQGNDIYNVAPNVPFSADPQATSVYMSNPHTSWVTGSTATTPLFPAGLTSLARTYPNPAVAQFSLGVQHEISPSIVGVMQYVGNIAWHQNTQRRINNFPLSTPGIITDTTGTNPFSTLYSRANAGDPNNNSKTNPNHLQIPNTNIMRTYQGFASINQQENTSNGNYHGFQIGVRARNRGGLSGEINYVWSHAIDIQSTDNGPQISNPWNLKYDKGSGAFDRRHIINANYIYRLPFFNGSSGLTHKLLGGWELAGTFVFQTGSLLDATPGSLGPGLSINYDPIGLGGGYRNRPDVIAPIHYTKSVNSAGTAWQWFNATSFGNPAPSWTQAGFLSNGFGNTRKDTVIGPGRTNFNTSLYKTFAFTERVNFQLRWETYNTFNHTQPNVLGNNFGNGNFGQVTSTFDPRTMELGGRITF